MAGAPEPMSTYEPKPESLRAVRREDARGWDIHDAHGYLDGPYYSERDCIEVISRYRDEFMPQLEETL